MKRFSASILGVCFGAAGFVLRLLQNRTGFEPDTGLPVPGNIPALALPVLLVLAAVVLYLAACRTLPQKAEEPFEVRFRLDDKGGLTAVLAGSCIMAAWWQATLRTWVKPCGGRRCPPPSMAISPTISFPKRWLPSPAGLFPK